MTINQNILDMARAEAKQSDLKRAKISALALDKRMRNIICKAHNAIFMGSKKKFSIHAEEYLLSKLRKPIDDSMIIFIYRATAGGAGCSRPCNKCMKLLIISGIKNICYMDEDNNYTMERIA